MSRSNQIGDLTGIVLEHLGPVNSEVVRLGRLLGVSIGLLRYTVLESG